ncbi:hypothetical protein K1X12_02525 [Hyphomonas sp. WL0036]|uniref:hypothetical protein n=1 Tax=Hyphomonas sediminis TaxID=2866160 RepID=UPI001C80A398|nr:hypothetical protein [Hyphomonas sediminis]MBY9065755.1 hypothetical protein [Hyphomonas sediminis]
MADASGYEPTQVARDIVEAFAGISGALRTFEIELLRLQDVLSMEFEAAGVSALPAEMQSLDHATQGVAAVAQLAERLHHCITSDRAWTLVEAAEGVRPINFRDQLLKAAKSSEGGDVLLF